MVGLDTRLRGVLGGRTATPLATELGLHTVGDLLRHYPRRQRELTNLGSLRVGEHVTVLAAVKTATLREMRNRRGWLLEVVVTDGTGDLTLAFFGKHPNVLMARKAALHSGQRGLFAGKVTVFNTARQLAHPNYDLLHDGQDLTQGFVTVGVPVYPATAKVSSWDIVKAVRVVLDTLDEPPDPLPAALRAQRKLISLGAALRGIHQPRDRDEVRRATERLTWDEAFMLQVALAQRRAAAAATPAVPRRAAPDGLLMAFDARAPFALTRGQREIGAVIAGELAESHPMHRLLQGEVGSGKTVVALRAMLAVVDAGGQAALLAPTEVLAQQHARSLADLLGPLATAGELGAPERATRLTLVTGSLGTVARRGALAELASGAAGLVLGTHALLVEDIVFHDLGLVVVDEQHRFGVEQRDALRAKGDAPPHVLVMTATPIPRTVAMTVYGDLEISTLTELPVGRQPVRTFVVPPESPAWLDRMWGRVRQEVAAGRQAFVVCPRIGDGVGDDGLSDDDLSDDDLSDDDLSVEGPASQEQREADRPTAAVLEVAPLLAHGELRGLRVGMVHGRLSAQEKDTAMRCFAAGELDVLVATTVIEVGVDVANATVMVVLDADCFGVSQLHQLRGRVGRGNVGGWCLLQTSAPPGTPARQRVEAVAATSDGFALARLDLEQRREGDVLGAAQHGRHSQLKLLQLVRDEELIIEARTQASALIASDPSLAEHPVLAAVIASTLDGERAEYLEKA